MKSDFPLNDSILEDLAYTEKTIFATPNTIEYMSLHKLNSMEFDMLNDYLEDHGVSVTYDSGRDTYIVMKEYGA